MLIYIYIIVVTVMFFRNHGVNLKFCCRFAGTVEVIRWGRVQVMARSLSSTWGSEGWHLEWEGGGGGGEVYFSVVDGYNFHQSSTFCAWTEDGGLWTCRRRRRRRRRERRRRSMRRRRGKWTYSTRCRRELSCFGDFPIIVIDICGTFLWLWSVMDIYGLSQYLW